MGIVEILLSAIGLAADAFAVSVCKGLSSERPKKRDYIAVGLWFGGFQALMPLLGYLLGRAFEQYISAVDHWIAFGLLVLVGANMIRESFKKEEEEMNSSFSVKAMLPLAIATSIDAFAVGVSISLSGTKIGIGFTVLIIGLITFGLSCAGLKIGNLFGEKFGKKAELAGGIILILLGIKILLSDLGVLPF